MLERGLGSLVLVGALALAVCLPAGAGSIAPNLKQGSGPRRSRRAGPGGRDDGGLPGARRAAGGSSRLESSGTSSASRLEARSAGRLEPAAGAHRAGGGARRDAQRAGALGHQRRRARGDTARDRSARGTSRGALGAVRPGDRTYRDRRERPRVGAERHAARRRCRFAPVRVESRREHGADRRRHFRAERGRKRAQRGDRDGRPAGLGAARLHGRRRDRGGHRHRRRSSAPRSRRSHVDQSRRDPRQLDRR